MCLNIFAVLIAFLPQQVKREVVAQSEGHRKHATAIILLGVIGAYYGQALAEGEFCHADK